MVLTMMGSSEVNKMINSRVLSLFLLVTFLFAPGLHADELKKWPREVKVSSGSITVYQPQIESLEKNILKGRAAMAYHAAGDQPPVFGVAWFTARVEIDRPANSVHFESFTITDTRLPDDNKKIGEEFKKGVDAAMKASNLSMSLDALTTALAAVDQEQKQAADLKNVPPKILYLEEPALLVSIDGKTSLQKVENSKFKAVVNTPYPLFNDGQNWYLNVAEKVWYKAKDVDGPWTFDAEPPADLKKMVAAKAAKYDKDSPVSKSTITSENAPLIVISHTAAELVVSVGKASFQPLTDNLLAMSNTESDVFMDVGSQQFFLVISGRWFTADSMKGKWSYVASDALPATFQDIPVDSKYVDVRAYVAGTDEAKEAVMDAQIPQTAAVKRGTVELNVTCDGSPKFEEIGGTKLSFAVNCSDTIMQSGKDFYLVRDAVWYIAGSATGPWVVSDKAPPGIDGIPPSSPVYNTKYVYVYDSTPDVVYVGYTPGYVGSYVYGPTIVYGTGWYYSPWVSPYYYYPRPATWGLSVAYNPWTGWGFGMSWSSGPFTFGFYTGGGYHGSYWGRGYYGPRGYRRSYNNIHIDNVNINTRNNFNNVSNRNNLYRNSDQRANITNSVNARSISGQDRQEIKDRAQGRQNTNVAALATAGAAGGAAVAVNRQSAKNNIMADRDGNVLRNNDGQWQQRSGGQWQDRAPAKKAETVQRSSGRDFSGYNRSSSMDRQNYSRQRATTRTNRSMGGGGHRGGGRRR
jgi:hypothetical protein